MSTVEEEIVVIFQTSGMPRALETVDDLCFRKWKAVLENFREKYGNFGIFFLVAPPQAEFVEPVSGLLCLKSPPVTAALRRYR